MSIFIRPAEEKDLDGVLEIYNDAILNTTAIYNYLPYTRKDIEQWYTDKKTAKHPVFVAIVDDSVAGFTSYGQFRLRPAYKYSVEHSVYVHPNFRGRGIAKKLLLEIIEAAKQNNIHAIVAGIDADNKVSIGLHRQFNFAIVGNIKEVGYKFGKWLDLTFMELVLETPKHPVEK
jgi:L-amino acid N-acyltransferase YncA